jgi:hypothetical protein
VPTDDATSTLVSPRRLGAALHAHRIAAGVTMTALSRRCDGWWTPDELLEVERGAVALDDASIVSLCRLYALPGRGLAEAHDLDLVVDRSASSELVATPGATGELPPSAVGPESVRAGLTRLAALLAVVGVDLANHASWTALLADAMGTSEIEVRREVGQVLGDRARLAEVRDALSDRIAVPAVGLLVCDAPGGSVVLVRRAGGAVRPGAQPVPAAGPLRWFDAPLAVGA